MNSMEQFNNPQKPEEKKDEHTGAESFYTRVSATDTSNPETQGLTNPVTEIHTEGREVVTKDGKTLLLLDDETVIDPVTGVPGFAKDYGELKAKE